MSDRPLLVPTPHGPVGAIVTEPAGELRAALVMVQGDGRPGRSGINAVWTRLARELAEQGIMVLRFDYPGEGDGTMIPKNAVPGLVHKGWLALMLLEEVVAWWREHARLSPLIAAGECLGGQIAIQLALRDPEVVGAFVSVPYVRARFVELEERRRPASSAPDGPGRLGRDDFDPDVLRAVPDMLARGPVWMLRGERDGDEADQLKGLLGDAAQGLEIEVVPGMALHPAGSPDVQAELARRFARRILLGVEEISSARGQRPSTAASSPAR